MNNNTGATIKNVAFRGTFVDIISIGNMNQVKVYFTEDKNAMFLC